MTLTAPVAALLDLHTRTGPAPLVAQSAPGVAVVLTLPDRLRVIVAEARDERRLRRTSARVADGARFPGVVAAADALLAAGRDLCSSICVADLWPDGQVDLEVRNAPPAIVLAPDSPARLLAATTGPDGGRARLAAGEVLLLCSPSFLEDPPTVLGTVRDAAPGAEDLEVMRRVLVETCTAGATVSVRMPMAA